MFKSVKVMLVGVGLAFGAMQVQAADVTDALMFQDGIARGYIEQDTRSGDVEVGVQVNLPSDYIALVKQSGDDLSATVAKTVFLTETIQFAPSVEYTIGEAGAEDQRFHNVYVEGLVSWQVTDNIITYGAGGYNFVNEDADDFSTLKLGADYFYDDVFTVGYHFTRNHTREATDFFPDDKFVANEHEVSVLLTGDMVQPYVALRVTDVMGRGYETSGSVGLNVAF